MGYPGTTYAAEIIDLGHLEDSGGFSSQAYGVSANGSVVAGKIDLDGGGSEAFRWTAAGGMVGLGDLPGGLYISLANGISGDGNVVVGISRSANGAEAFRWTAAGGMVGLGDLTGGLFLSFAHATSANGDVVVGYGNTDNGDEAFRWTAADGMVGIGHIVGGTFSRAYGISDDGLVIAGQGNNATDTVAFRWTAADGMVGLGHITGASRGQARAVSGNGEVIVGLDQNPGSWTQAFRWTAADGTVGLGFLPAGAGSYAYGVSYDGAVVVGNATSHEIQTAFRWTDADGMQPVLTLLEAEGIDMTGWNLHTASDVSDDGSVIVGWGTTPDGDEDAWIAEFGGSGDDGSGDDGSGDDGGTGIIGMTDFSNSLGDLAKGRTLGHKVGRLMTATVGAFSSSHAGKVHQPILGKTLISPVVLYAKGSDMLMGGATVEHVMEAATFKAALASAKATDDGRYNGDLEISGYSVAVAAELRLGKLAKSSRLDPLNISVGYSRGFYDGDFDRTYLNGATPEISNGDPDVDTVSAFFKTGWNISISDKINLMPYVQLTYQKTEIDSYTEQGGSFPGTVAKQEETNTERTFGLEAAWQLSDSLIIGTDLALVNLRDDQGPDLSVNVPGIGAFVYPGEKYDATWGELALNAQWKIMPNLSIFGELRGTTGSDYPEDYSTRVELAYMF